MQFDTTTCNTTSTATSHSHLPLPARALAAVLPERGVRGAAGRAGGWGGEVSDSSRRYLHDTFHLSPRPTQSLRRFHPSRLPPHKVYYRRTLTLTSPSYTSTNFPAQVADPLLSSLTNFTTSLSTFACGRDMYSPLVGCAECQRRYREWVCGVGVPRCGEVGQDSGGTGESLIVYW